MIVLLRLSIPVTAQRTTFSKKILGNLFSLTHDGNRSLSSLVLFSGHCERAHAAKAVFVMENTKAASPERSHQTAGINQCLYYCD